MGATTVRVDLTQEQDYRFAIDFGGGLPPLRGKLHKERYGVLKPIKPQRGG